MLILYRKFDINLESANIEISENLKTTQTQITLACAAWIKMHADKKASHTQRDAIHIITEPKELTRAATRAQQTHITETEDHIHIKTTTT